MLTHPALNTRGHFADRTVAMSNISPVCYVLISASEKRIAIVIRVVLTGV
jgi:hypothetical protein